MGATSKQRSTIRCREWERKRRNIFNEAIAKLGELIKTTNKENVSSKDADTTQYPKIEIIQRAILFIEDYSQEKSKLKAEILALQIKLEDSVNKNKEKRDVSTQINKVLRAKLKNGKPIKSLVLKKIIDNSLKQPTQITNNEKISMETTPTQILPKLLPKSLAGDPKGAENTIVVVPGAPYIIPQRPLLFPTAPPTFVLLNPNIQPINKSVLNRTGNEITKTTMVNILPISAYSRPMSAKTKKNYLRQKTDVAKKKVKTAEKSVEQLNKSTNQNKHKLKEASDIGKKDDKSKQVDNNIEQLDLLPSALKTSSDNQKGNDKIIESKKVQPVTDIAENKKDGNPKPNSDKKLKSICIRKDNIDKGNTNEVCVRNNTKSVTNINNKESIPNLEQNIKVNVDKDSQPVEKNKLSNILDSALCENTVDGGNARLELAEELLAASPTAAFLMSFPLVSGNRADSPAEDTSNVVQSLKENNQRCDVITTQPMPFFEKSITNDTKEKSNNTVNVNKQVNSHKFIEVNETTAEAKIVNTTTVTSAENPFLNLPLPSAISTNCTIPDAAFSLDFDCNLPTKSLPNQSTYGTSNNIFYKNDPFNTVKNAIYSTSSISSGPDFNNLGLYPCAMEKFSSKTKTDYTNVEENLMKIGSSRLTYDIDLGWSHKGLDFVNCTTNSTTFNKDNLLTTVSTPYCTSYNPFNPEFHVPLVSSTSKKETLSKPSSSFADTIASYYSQTSNLWPEEIPFYTGNSISSSKPFTSKHQNYLPLDQSYTAMMSKQNSIKQYETKTINVNNYSDNLLKSSTVGITQQQQVIENSKYTKKSPSKMHINWMTSETRPLHNVQMPTIQHDTKEPSRVAYRQMPLKQSFKKQDRIQQENDGNYFPINIHNYPSQVAQEEFPVWPSTRPLGTTEISIDPPPINLPTLIGDLALGPHDRKKNAEASNRNASQTELQNCSNFLSVTQLMNRSTDNMASRCPAPAAIDQTNTKSLSKQNIPHYSTDNRKLSMSSRLDHHLSQPCYSFNDSKVLHTYDSMNQYSTKAKSKTTDKTAKNQKHSYSAESLIRSGSYTQNKIEDNKIFPMTPQKYADCNPHQDNSVAQVSHFPPIIDYSDNSYTGQQLSGTTLYNSTTNTISNSFYTNFIPGSTNLMSSNYAGAPFSTEFIDYNQSECNYTNHKYEEFKIKGNPMAYHHEKASNHKSSRREFSAKHKSECSKKDSNLTKNSKYQSKRPKLSTEVEEWSESNNLWPNKTPTKRHSNLIADELTFPNYAVGNQMTAQYQPDIFNSHLIPPNVQSVGHNGDRPPSNFPITSRANFNLSTIFPEITMKVQ